MMRERSDYGNLDQWSSEVKAGKITQIKEFTPAAWAKTKEKMVAQAAWANRAFVRFIPVFNFRAGPVLY